MQETKCFMKLEHIYVITDESTINFKTINKNLNDLNFIFESHFNQKAKFSNDYVKILQGLDYLNLESLHLIEKALKGKKNSENFNYKKLNKERLTTIFKCLGFNIIYCPIIAENIFTELFLFANVKEGEIQEQNDNLRSSIVIRQSIFFDIAKHVIRNLTGTKCSFKKYFNLSYLIISKNK